MKFSHAFILPAFFLVFTPGLRANGDEARPTDMKQMCESVGTAIAAHGEKAAWMKLNDPDPARRRLVLISYLDGHFIHGMEARQNKTIRGSTNPHLKNDEEKFLAALKPHLSVASEFRYLIPLAGTVQNGLNEAYRIADYQYFEVPHANGSLLLRNSWAEFTQDPRYSQALTALAIKLYPYVQLGVSAPGNFDDDLRAEFLGLGLSYAEADRMTWVYLGLYGSQGAFLHDMRMGMSEIFSSFDVTASDFIILAVSYLDSLKPVGQLYSLPATIHSSCKLGKPYHFWMTAFLSREMAKKRDVKTSVEGPFLLGMDYVFYSRTNGRSNDGGGSEYVHQNLFSMKNNSARVDLSVHAVGAAFGASRAVPSIDVDAFLRLSVEKARKPRYIFNQKKIDWRNPVERQMNLEKEFGVRALVGAAVRTGLIQ
jgi:hypothetical protein